MYSWAYQPSPVIYFFSVLFNTQIGDKNKILNLLKTEFKNLDFASDLFTTKANPLKTYYAKQMGQDTEQLERFFCYSKLPLNRDLLADIKIQSMELEKYYQKDFRTLNLDPGYVAAEQMILSSHKPYAHRLYVKDGVYFELEYLYKNNNWIELPWTYPDYIDHEKKNYFLAIRKLLL